MLKVKFLSLALLLFGALAITIAGGYLFGPLLVFLLSFFAYFDKEKSQLDNDDWYLLGALVVFSLVGLVDTIFHQQPLSNFDLFSRYLIGAWVVYYLLRYELNSKYLMYGYAIGAIAAGVYSLYAYFYLGQSRVGSATYHAIQFGNISLLLAFFSFTAAIYTLKRKKVFFSVIFLMAAGLGFCASILSGSRGGWLAIPVCLLVLYFYFMDFISAKSRTIIKVITVVCLILAVNSNPVSVRIDSAWSDIKAYEQGNSYSSVGLRFDMWEIGFSAFKEAPFFGHGEEQLYQYRDQLVASAGYHREISSFNHLHNQYIDELAKRGLVGLFGLLTFLIVPAYLFFKRVRSPILKVRCLSAAGSILMISIAIFALTEGILRSTVNVMFFTFSLVFLWVLVRMTEKAHLSMNK